MNVGFVNVYPYRPHGHHAKYIEYLLSKEFGDFTSYTLNCDLYDKQCYLKELKGLGRSACLKCGLGNLSTFSFDKNSTFSDYKRGKDLFFDYKSLVASSSYTLARIESAVDKTSEDVTRYQESLLPGAKLAFNAALRWIEQEKINLIILFNARMDYTRAVFEAAKVSGIDCIIHERPLFGHGLILNLNSNCSSLSKIHDINKYYSDKYLTKKQADYAASLLAQRFVNKNDLEWKKYNEDPTDVIDWPTTSKYKVLVCPSSKNELLGHEDWLTPWENNTDAIDMLLKNTFLTSNDIVVRFHPSWAVNFGINNADDCIRHYKEWCESRGICYIPSESKANTRDLIKLSDLVLLNGSNTILEVGALGVPSICLGPSPYTHSGASIDVLSYDDLCNIDLEKIFNSERQKIITQTLRYVYNKACREPLFLNGVRSSDVVTCRYFSVESSDDIFKRILEGELVVGDDSFAETNEEELLVVDKLLEMNFQLLNEYSESSIIDFSFSSDITGLISRKTPFKLVDKIRSSLPKGV